MAGNRQQTRAADASANSAAPASANATANTVVVADASVDSATAAAEAAVRTVRVVGRDAAVTGSSASSSSAVAVDFNGNNAAAAAATTAPRSGSSARSPSSSNDHLERTLRSTPSPFPDNRVITSKYTALNFLPKNLFEQFRRVANFYFLCVALIQLIPGVAPVSPLTSILPLVFVVGVTAIKQAYEDYLRHLADNETNTRPVTVMRRGVVLDIQNEQIHVGDIVRIVDGQEFPCDLTLLSTSDADGHCYTITANLDGETNLKVRSAPVPTRHLRDFGALRNLSVTIDCGLPTADLYRFTGRLFSGVLLSDASSDSFFRVSSSSLSSSPSSSSSLLSADRSSRRRAGGQDQESGGSRLAHSVNASAQSSDTPATSSWPASWSLFRKPHDALSESASFPGRSEGTISSAVPLDISNLLHKGARLRNTEFVYGVAVYTGRDTKMVLNQQPVKHKFSSLERLMNKFLIVFFIGLFVVCLISTLLTLAWNNHYRHVAWYLGDLGLPAAGETGDIFLFYAGQFITFMLLYNYCIPISLYVTVELLKFFGALLIHWDEKMADKVNTSDKQPSMAKANTSDLNEELALVDYVFSDKTGTLTENVMKFVECSVAGRRYLATRDGLVEQADPEAQARLSDAAAMAKREQRSRAESSTSATSSVPTTASSASPLHRLALSFRRGNQSGDRIPLIGAEDDDAEEQSETPAEQGDTTVGGHPDALATGAASPKGRGSGASSRNSNRSADAIKQDLAGGDDEGSESEDDYDKYLPASLLEASSSLAQAEKSNPALRVYLTALAACHTVFAERVPHGHHHQHQSSTPVVSQQQQAQQAALPLSIHYQASSPDEEALVSGAARAGVVFERRTVETLHLVVQGKPQAFELLHVLEFSSDRKRMSVIVRDEQGVIWVFTKGAESVIEPRLSADEHTFLHRMGSSSSGVEIPRMSTIKTTTMDHLGGFATSGLRTLLVAAKQLSNDEFAQIRESLHQASVALHNRDALFAAAYERIEHGLVLLGAAAIEDKLQADVDLTMKRLRGAGIKVWVLTGDKQETAINISMACGHVSSSMRVLYLNAHSRRQCSETIRQYLREYASDRAGAFDATSFGDSANAATDAARERFAPEPETTGTNTVGGVSSYGSVVSASAGHSQASPLRADESLEVELSAPHHGPPQLALVIDGATLAIALKHDSAALLALCQRCAAVLCCRMSPMQKALLVRLVKESPERPVTLAIGDGANDVSMIQEAHVGVGIMGKEGRQAACSSDYAFAKFRSLQRLLLVHGRYSYIRIADVALYFFYKNVAWIAAELLFAFYSGFSGQTIYDSVLLMLFNIVFTSLPALVHGMVEKDVSERSLLRYPRLYSSLKGPSARISSKALGQWMLSSFWHALVVFFGGLLVFGGWSAVASSSATVLTLDVGRNVTAASSWGLDHSTTTDIDVFTLGAYMNCVMLVVVTIRLLMEEGYVTWLNWFVLIGSLVVLGAFMLFWSSFMISEPYYLFHSAIYLAGLPQMWLGLLLLVVTALLPDFVFKVVYAWFWPRDWQLIQEEEYARRESRRARDAHFRGHGGARRVMSSSNGASSSFSRRGKPTDADDERRGLLTA
ncbi:ATPase [Capsaspora owczarzaki ATCC 30864]|uniref:ATPase n=1 Tax=Capsaspora owczarzaki (strain ATCC 30864) TaxID=595528 RepID=A0A0D2WQ85_CAPO3|nr:ATPase [Capsaspora owczarzaki ATCC 30864]KJE93765.1 ATPase [Capsaspora owczarzaki ATCC 30864]|eukprot:XP_004347259.1 ATPase [Capsaspora owczarzaki ATCC 30864]